MANRTYSIVAIIAAIALAGVASLTVVARSEEPDDGTGAFLRHLHEMAQHLHGGAHQPDPMAELIEQLELTPDQQQHLEKIHEILGSHGDGGTGSMVGLHNRLVAQFEQGQLETDEIRRLVDGHVEQLREIGYAVTDELIALVNGLDARQREVLQAHLQANHEEHDVHHP